MENLFDPIAYAARQAAIAELMARVATKRLDLTQRIVAGDVQIEDAHRRNDTMPGRLGELWSTFMTLPAQEQADALGQPEFRGMAWQSLLQCNPYLLRAHEIT